MTVCPCHLLWMSIQKIGEQTFYSSVFMAGDVRQAFGSVWKSRELFKEGQLYQQPGRCPETNKSRKVFFFGDADLHKICELGDLIYRRRVQADQVLLFRREKDSEEEEKEEERQHHQHLPQRLHHLPPGHTSENGVFGYGAAAGEGIT